MVVNDIIHKCADIENEISLLYYLENNSSIDVDLITTNAHKFYKRLYPNRNDIDLIIPRIKHKERLTLLNEQHSKLYNNNIAATEIFNFYKKDIIPTFRKIEDNKIYTISGEYEKTKFNIFTTTGRPSNSNNGINYAALNKDDGTRDKYISRFNNGKIVEMDYDAFHLRLIAELIDYKSPNESFHKYLGKQYFNTDSLTDEQYAESKKITFRILYGGLPDEYKHIEYFSLINDLIFKNWDIYNKLGYIETPKGKRFYKRNLGKTTPQKLFNYIIQAYETEFNTLRINAVSNILNKSKIILYIYDALVFDMHPDELEKIKEIEQALLYPVKTKIGSNYGNLSDIYI
jgi:DNA polymerase I-like protein with 3'-5' exonuclease and polymerase domains